MSWIGVTGRHSGVTHAGHTKWVQHGPRSLFVDIDTVPAAFDTTPFYFTSLLRVGDEISVVRYTSAKNGSGGSPKPGNPKGSAAPSHHDEEETLFETLKQMATFVLFIGTSVCASAAAAKWLGDGAAGAPS